jgi:hypothetical protein
MLDGPRVQFAHLGCKLLGTIAGDKKTAEASPDVFREWDTNFGKQWRDKSEPIRRLASTLATTVGQANASGLVLWDTMRKGSNAWRPGAYLTDAADQLRRIMHGCAVSYAREDALCPPRDLLEKAARERMSFGDYADAYAQHLRSEGGLEMAAAAVVMASACGRLAAFYCTDPYIPRYTRPGELLDDTPYSRRHWLPGLPRQGCHRVVLAAEVAKLFRDNHVSVELLEVDQTFGQCHVRAYGWA